VRYFNGELPTAELPVAQLPMDLFKAVPGEGVEVIRHWMEKAVIFR
jgi:hypothetical protein